MKTEINIKVKAVMGIVALLVSSIVVSFITFEYKKDWIILIAVIVTALVFLKAFSCDEIELSIYNKLGKHLKVISIILVLLGLSLLPDSLGERMSEGAGRIGYCLSYIFWFTGLYLHNIRSKYKEIKEEKCR